MSEAYARLAVVLPLLLLALGALLYAAKRGLIRLPGAMLGTPPLRVVQVVALGPGARLAVVEFAGAQHLLGIGRDGVCILHADLAPPTPSPSLKREGDSKNAGIPLPFKGGARGGSAPQASPPL